MSQPTLVHVANLAADPQCHICLEECTKVDAFTHPGAEEKHQFHADCINRWINGSHVAGKAQCPVCKYEINVLSDGSRPLARENHNLDQGNALMNVLFNFVDVSFISGPNGEVEVLIPLPSSSLEDFTGDGWNPMTGDFTTERQFQ